MCTGKVSPAAISRLGTDTDALPPGVTSCANTIRVTPRMRRWPELRSESEVCRSRTVAPPRANDRDCPQSAESGDTTVTGESFGKSILNEPCVSACAHTGTTANTPEIMATLLRINIVDRHLARILIDITGSQGASSIHHHYRRRRPDVHHGQRRPVLRYLNAVPRRFERDSRLDNRSLPIPQPFDAARQRSSRLSREIQEPARHQNYRKTGRRQRWTPCDSTMLPANRRHRSEERRVGKE